MSPERRARMNLGEAVAISIAAVFWLFAIIGIINHKPALVIDIMTGAALVWLALSLMCRMARP